MRLIYSSPDRKEKSIHVHMIVIMKFKVCRKHIINNSYEKCNKSGVFFHFIGQLTSHEIHPIDSLTTRQGDRKFRTDIQSDLEKCP